MDKEREIMDKIFLGVMKGALIITGYLFYSSFVDTCASIYKSESSSKSLIQKPAYEINMESNKMKEEYKKVPILVHERKDGYYPHASLIDDLYVKLSERKPLSYGKDLSDWNLRLSDIVDELTLNDIRPIEGSDLKVGIIIDITGTFERNIELDLIEGLSKEALRYARNSGAKYVSFNNKNREGVQYKAVMNCDNYSEMLGIAYVTLYELKGK